MFGGQFGHLPGKHLYYLWGPRVHFSTQTPVVQRWMLIEVILMEGAGLLLTNPAEPVQSWGADPYLEAPRLHALV